MDQLDPIAINDCEEGWLSQETGTPILVGEQRPLQTGPLWQLTKQPGKVTLKPTVERPKVTTLECKQQPDGYQLAWPQVCLRMLRGLAHPVVYLTKQSNDKLFGSHEVLFSLLASHLTASENLMLMSN